MSARAYDCNFSIVNNGLPGQPFVSIQEAFMKNLIKYSQSPFHLASPVPGMYVLRLCE